MMNITPQMPNLSIPTVLNPHTESLRRENNQREVITKPTPTSPSVAEKGVASDKERGRTPAQNNANIDFASISKQAEIASTSISDQGEKQNPEQNSDQNDTRESQDSTGEAEEQSNSADGERQSRAQALEQDRIISQFQSRDKEVRAHESAHSSVGGAFTGAPSFSYETGPDGRRYAVEGEVSVDLSSVKGNPRATIAKMQKVHAAALAPVHPSVQDTQVAASAIQIILKAQSELLAEHDNASNGNKSERASSSTNANTHRTLTQGEQATEGSSKAEQNFDTLINQTLKAQENIAPTRSEDVIQRADRIENFYSNISLAYKKPATYQFNLTA